MQLTRWHCWSRTSTFHSSSECILASVVYSYYHPRLDQPIVAGGTVSPCRMVSGCMQMWGAKQNSTAASLKSNFKSLGHCTTKIRDNIYNIKQQNYEKLQKWMIHHTYGCQFMYASIMYYTAATARKLHQYWRW